MKNIKSTNTSLNKLDALEKTSVREDFLHKNSELNLSNESLKKITNNNNLLMNNNVKDNKVKSRKDVDSYLIDKSLILSDEKKSFEKKQRNSIKKVKQKKYIVDTMENIISKVSKPKLKLILQEFFLYAIVFLVCLHYWIFLFLSTTKFEQNYCFTSQKQFDTCSEEQICGDYTDKLNIVIYNYTMNSYTYNSKNIDDLLIKEYREINNYYRSFFLEYSNLLSKNKIFNKMQMDSTKDKTNFAIFMTYKEKWNIFLKYFSFCNFDNYYNVFIVMIAIGGICGSFLFGLLSDIYGRITIIRITLFLSTIANVGIYTMCVIFDKFYNNLLEYYKTVEKFNDIVSYLSAQKMTGDIFNKYFIIIVIGVFLLNFSLWPLLKSCMALLIENSKGDLEVLVNFRRYNFVFGGLPPLFTSLILVNINNFNLTFLILIIVNFIIFLYSCIFMEESIRYYYEYCEWKKLTEVIKNIYKIDINDFRTLNENELERFQKKEEMDNFNNFTRNMDLFIKNDKSGNPIIILKNTFFNDLIEKKNTLVRKLKRNDNYIIKYKDVKSNPLIIIISLFSNHAYKRSKILIFIILILLYIVMDLFQKELVEPPFFDIKDFYLSPKYNYILNSIFFTYLIINILSNYFFYAFYRIDCFKTIIVISLLFISFNLVLYHFLTIESQETPIDLNAYNFSMTNYYYRNKRSILVLIPLFAVYFALNGIIFYVYLLTLKISKTIYRCTFFSIHSFSLIAAMMISESIYYYMEDYFLFLAMLSLLCLLTLIFLSDFKELLFVMNDLKIGLFNSSKNMQQKTKNE